MIETDDEIEQLINAFENKRTLFKSEELEGLEIPIRLGFSKLLDRKQNCSESQQNFDYSSNLDFGNSNCESAIFGKKRKALSASLNLKFQMSDFTENTSKSIRCQRKKAQEF
jgi:hypothetical protein